MEDFDSPKSFDIFEGKVLHCGTVDQSTKRSTVAACKEIGPWAFHQKLCRHHWGISSLWASKGVGLVILIKGYCEDLMQLCTLCNQSCALPIIDALLFFSLFLINKNMQHIVLLDNFLGLPQKKFLSKLQCGC